MPTRRRRKSRGLRKHDPLVTPEMIRAFLSADYSFFVDALSLKPWELAPCDGVLDLECDAPPDTAGERQFHEARTLRLRILRAIQGSPELRRDRALQREAAETIATLERVGHAEKERNG